MQDTQYLYKTIASPVGELTLVATATALAAILWENNRPGWVRLGPRHEDRAAAILLEAERQLNEYFAGVGFLN
jgi:methylated-DNA-[protein]-cysteine S-methyltransferase